MKRSPLNQKSYFYAEKILISNFANSQTRFRAIMNIAREDAIKRLVFASLLMDKVDEALLFSKLTE